MRAIELALREPWAMEESALAGVLAIAARENEITPQALEAYRAKNLEGAERAQIRDGVAVISATGPLLRRANIFTAISGATSYDIMRRDLQAAVDAGVKGVLLDVDSPGGAVNGAAELAQAVYDLRGKVPVIAYVGGTGASAAYWIASAADAVVIDPTAILGSIGVQMAMTVGADEKGANTFTFISSQSPMKNADPATKDGAAALQAMVDSLAQVFVETVARNRGVPVATVLANFGKGGVFVGKQAVAAGLADRTGTFESVLTELKAGKTTMTTTTSTPAASTVWGSAPSPQAGADNRTREEKIRALAAGAPLPLPAGTLEAALASAFSAEQFAIAIADHATAARAAAAHDAAIDARAMDIVRSADAARGTDSQTSVWSPAKIEARAAELSQAPSFGATGERSNIEVTVAEILASAALAADAAADAKLAEILAA